MITATNGLTTKLWAFLNTGLRTIWDLAGGAILIGNPKQPTFSVYQLVDGEYQVSLFRGSDRVVSQTFGQLNLSVQQIFSAGRDTRENARLEDS